MRELRRVVLAQLPTPLERAVRLGDALGIELWIKREDQSGLGLGGNKARQIEVILAEALQLGADTVVTTAGAQSNFCRALAAGAARIGLRCILLLRGDGSAAVTGNLLLDRLFGAEIHWIDTADPYDPRVRERLRELAANARGRAHIIQLPGVTGPLAAAAAAGLGVEIAERLNPARTYVAAGSGLTAAGLALGLAGRGEVVAVSVQQPAAFITPLIRRRIGEAADLLDCDGVASAVRVEDRFIGPGYALPSPEGLAALVMAARLEGLVLDPAYTGKALACLIAEAKEAKPADGPVVFVHSGGAPALFAHGDAVAGHLSA